MREQRIFVAGATGMVGSAVVRELQRAGYQQVLGTPRAELDCRNPSAVADFFTRQRPELVIIAAARVGGIHANDTYPADFLYDNLMIEANLIDAARRHDVQRLVFLGSSCIYPRMAPQPIPESALLTGALEPTNEAYAIAKIAGIKLCESYARQHGCDFRSLMPTNLYGPGDNFHPQDSHVIPALLQRFHHAIENDRDVVTVWGSGAARREFLHVDDLAAAVRFMLELPRRQLESAVTPRQSHLNVGTGEDLSIADLVSAIVRVTGYRGRVEFDRTRPDGTPRKLLDTSVINRLGWHHRISLDDGLRDTWRWFLDNQARLRR
ncbi:MAG: GDP-L-fucose synthase [Pseudomonadales bacterium]|nr:GDP-L-fucose synthase [Pseudomonadales bacterium]MCP5184566.1 GDP-L-fucose synthase [Pseudomonadales bacterium]